MASRGYEFFDHTADVGIRAEGATLAELCTQLARGLVELIAEDSPLTSRESRTIELTAEDAESLVLAWLKERLFQFSTERFLPVEYALAEVTPTMLRGTLRGERFDPARHVQGREVKAITQHQLSVRQRNSHWYGQVIVDI